MKQGGGAGDARHRQDRVRVPKTAELVAARISRRIIRGEVKEGEALLPESELMAEFGVSRPTLREAFRILESEALISVTRGSRGGARVHPPDIRVVARFAGLFLQYAGTTLEDVQTARVVVEPPAARMLAERRDREATAKLRELIAREELVLEDSHAFAELSTRFHELLMELAGNRTLALVVGMLHDIIEMHVESSMERYPDVDATRRSVRSQERLLELIEAGDVEGAEQHWRDHVRNAGRWILDVAGRKSVVDLFD